LFSAVAPICRADTDAMRIPSVEHRNRFCLCDQHRRCDLFRRFLRNLATKPDQWRARVPPEDGTGDPATTPASGSEDREDEEKRAMRTRKVGSAPRSVIGGIVLLLSAGIALTPPALAEMQASCRHGTTLVRLDTRVCPPLPRRPAVVIGRACCQDTAGKTRCQGFSPCPRRSPS
jgi:hypothetical protein